MQSLTVIVMNQFLLPYGNDKIAAMGIASKEMCIRDSSHPAWPEVSDKKERTRERPFFFAFIDSI